MAEQERLAGVLSAQVLRRAGHPAPVVSVAVDLPVGTMVRILPNHACATAARYGAHQVLGQDGAVAGQWPRFSGW